MRKIQRYGWRRNIPDHRDYKLAPPTIVTLPPLVDLSLNPDEPLIYDQGQLGSCTANAIAALFEADLRKQGLSDFMPSRLFIYYNERAVEGDTDQDNGAQLRDGFDTISKLGVCPEVDWPYDISKFAVKPGDDCYQAAKGNLASSYFSIPQVLNQLKACLSSGFRFCMGITVFESFESDDVANTGFVPMPSITESDLGGHAVSVVGYDDSKQCFKVRNSWGTGWGLKGYFYLPYAYLIDQNLGADFTTLRSVL